MDQDLNDRLSSARWRGEELSGKAFWQCRMPDPMDWIICSNAGNVSFSKDTFWVTFCWSKLQAGKSIIFCKSPINRCNWSVESSYQNFDFLRKIKTKLPRDKPWYGCVEGLHVWLGDTRNQHRCLWAQHSSRQLMRDDGGDNDLSGYQFQLNWQWSEYAFRGNMTTSIQSAVNMFGRDEI